MMAFSMVMTAGNPTADQSWVSRPNGSLSPCLALCAFDGSANGMVLWPCVGLRAHQHQSTSWSFSQVMMCVHHPVVWGVRLLATWPNSLIHTGAVLWGTGWGSVSRRYPPFVCSWLL